MSFCSCWLMLDSQRGVAYNSMGSEAIYYDQVEVQIKFYEISGTDWSYPEETEWISRRKEMSNACFGLKQALKRGLGMRNKGRATNQALSWRSVKTFRGEQKLFITLFSCETKGSSQVSDTVVIMGNWDWIGENCVTKRASKNSKYEENLNYMANETACESKW